MIAASLRQAGDRVDALQLRERALLLMASIVMTFLVIDSLGLQPIYQKKQALLQGIEAQELQLQKLRQRSNPSSEQLGDENVPSLVGLQEELEATGKALEYRLQGMLSPESASDILEQVLTHQDGITLTAMSTDLTRVGDVAGKERPGKLFEGVHRYELELQLQGGYLDTLRYLRALEALRWKFFWSGIKFSVDEFPTANVDLQIYTLGHKGT